MGYSEEIAIANSNSIAFFCKDVCIQKALEKVCLWLENIKKIEIDLSYYRNCGPETFDISWPTCRLAESEKLDNILTLVFNRDNQEEHLFFICNSLLIGELRSEVFSRVGVIEPFKLGLEKQIPSWLKEKIVFLSLDIHKVLDFLSARTPKNKFLSKKLDKLQALYLACISKITHALKNGDYYGGLYQDTDYPFFKRALEYIKNDVQKLKIYSLAKLIEKTQDLMQEKDLNKINEKFGELNQLWNKFYTKCTRIRERIFKEERWTDIVDDLKELEKIEICL